MNMNKISILLMMILLSIGAQAQFTLSAEFRPRTEYTHGLKALAVENSDYGLFTTQRSRLNFLYKGTDLQARIVLQDIRVFGNTKQLNETDGLTSIHEAWAEAKLAENFSIRIGRQELVYDDTRILGNVNWAQQGRSHDLFLLKFEKKFKLHAGFAFNMAEANLTSTVYTLAGNYKAMQFVWLHKDHKKLNYSLLLLNNGMQVTNTNGDFEVAYSTTAGGRLVVPINDVSLNANLYYQFGKDNLNQNLNAFNILAEARIPVGKKLKLTAGTEYLSGGQEFNSDNELVNTAFNPLYGTNHIFNGWMDYYYVGNHINSVGLLDLYLKTAFQMHEKSAIMLNFHSFSATSDIVNPLQPGTAYSRNLGLEIDFSIDYKLNEMSNVILGYSHYLGNESTEIIKGGSKDELSNWAWVMFQFTPVFVK